MRVSAINHPRQIGASPHNPTMAMMKTEMDWNGWCQMDFVDRVTNEIEL